MTDQEFPGWLPGQVARFYDFPMHLTGEGQSAAIISLGGKVDPDELAENFRRMRVPQPKLSIVDVDPENIEDAQNKMFTGETHLDVEVLASLVPEAGISIIRGSWKAGFAKAIDHAVDAGNTVLSVSWGYPEFADRDFASIEKALVRARKAGVTVCVSSGDLGSTCTLAPDHTVAPAFDNGAHVMYPASSPNVLACGGTALHLIDHRHRETVWNNITLKKGATGGGVSVLFDRPSWQDGFDIPHVCSRKSGRILPDVSGLAASRDWEIYMDGKARPAGGTSAVAPLWAALMVMVNQQRALDGKPPIGHVNESLYRLASTNALFRNVAEGNNRLNEDYPGYDAVAGFNACAGWGTPNAGRLLEALAAV